MANNENGKCKADQSSNHVRIIVQKKSGAAETGVVNKKLE
jgi:hypothetical protein